MKSQGLLGLVLLVLWCEVIQLDTTWSETIDNFFHIIV
jgi:hypothetical protein